MAAVSSDFVGPLRDRLDAVLRPGSTTLFLQGAGGNVLPLEGFFEHTGPEVPMGERLALEAARAVADADPWAMAIDRSHSGSLHPIELYRRRVASDQPFQRLRAARRIVALPLGQAPSIEELEQERLERLADLEMRRARGDGRASTNLVAYHLAWLDRTIGAARAAGVATELEGEIWGVRIGDSAIVSAPGEIFGEIGHAVRVASPAAVTLFAGYSQGVLGYVPTAAEYPFGGYEPTVSHRGYGQPAPFAPEAAGIIETSAIDLLRDLFVSD